MTPIQRANKLAVLEDRYRKAFAKREWAECARLHSRMFELRNQQMRADRRKAKRKAA